jgi:hypothetical protein
MKYDYKIILEDLIAGNFKHSIRGIESSRPDDGKPWNFFPLPNRQVIAFDFGCVTFCAPGMTFLDCYEEMRRFLSQRYSEQIRERQSKQ